MFALRRARGLHRLDDQPARQARTRRPDRTLPDPTDRRGVQLSLTADGRARLDDYIELGAAREQALLSRLTTADKRRLNQLLDKLLHSLHADLNQ